MSTPSNESSSLACHLMTILSEAREEHGTTAVKLIEKERLGCPFFPLASGTAIDRRRGRERDLANHPVGVHRRESSAQTVDPNR